MSTYAVVNSWSRTLRGMPQKGACAERILHVGERDIDLFTEMTGDRNPVHFDAEAARSTVFGGLIVQGGVTSGLLNTLAG